MTLLSLYERYQHVLASRPHSGRFLPYDWDALPESLDARWLAYSQMLSEFSRELANVINDLTNYVPRLEAWSEVVRALSNEEKLTACREFIDPLATVAVGLPYAIKARFVFAIAHLCHQANRARQGQDWQDNLTWDGDIKMDAAETLGSNWPSFKRLKARLDTVNGKAFRQATHDFRNAYNHRLSPRFVIGMTQMITRHVDPNTNSVFYGFGGMEALDLAEVSALLAAQRDNCYGVFEAFQALVQEHVTVITSNNTAAN
jgi:hypothetical protein